MGTDSKIEINYPVGNNFIDKTRKQYYMSDHAFRYCHNAYLKKKHKECSQDDFENDFYYKLPEFCYNKKLENDKDGIRYFTSWLEGSYDFKTLVLNNLIQIGERRTVNCNKFGKKIADGIYFKRYDEITRYLVNTDALMDEDASARFLKINESIIIIEQKIKVCDKDGLTVCDCLDREDVINFAKENLTKKQWISYYDTIGSEGKKLYIKRMILRKKQWNFNGKNYYVTATPGKLEKLGYTVNRDNAFNTPCKIKHMDIFVINNKEKCKSDMELFFTQLNYQENFDIETIAIANKQKVIEDFIIDNKNNSDFSNVNPVNKDSIHDVGREPSKKQRDRKNVTYVYQKGNQTQGTNYSEHIYLMQDCHVKIDIVERIVPSKDIEDIYIGDYLTETKDKINQSALRTLRGELEYKAISMFVNMEEEEIELVDHLEKYLQDYGIQVNVINVKDSTHLTDRQDITKSILRHINDRHKAINLKKEVDFYTFNNENLLKHEVDKRVKFNSDEVVKFFEACNDKIMTMSKFGISRRQLNRILKEYKCK